MQSPQQNTEIEPEKICAWLTTIPGVSDAIAGTVRIDGKSFPAVRYKQTSQTPLGCPAYDRGERESTREIIYCVGARPERMKQQYRIGGEYSCKHVYTLPGDSQDWYVTCYCEEIKPEQERFSPFGPSFMLSPWEVPSGEKIDHWHPEKPCIRVAISVQGQMQSPQQNAEKSYPCKVDRYTPPSTSLDFRQVPQKINRPKGCIIAADKRGPLELIKQRTGTYAVVYGLNVMEKMDRCGASRHYCKCLFHLLECEGLI